MNAQEINAAIGKLNGLTWDLENAYIENGGEVTEETEKMEGLLEEVKGLLTTEGVDSLGRWLKAKQDEIKTAKAEKAAADARIKSLQNTEEYIKSLVSRVLIATQTNQVKGTYYSFSQSTSTSTSVLTEALDKKYLEKVTKAARKAGLPDCVDVALKTNATRLQEAGEKMAEFVEVATSPAVKFTKPRAAKE
ncbi:MAG: siphovirus Gp157 family protein [Bacteroidales bacterium]|nr:siphovirus Gp157 family protein [Bacteroidales bacterium]